MQDRVRIIGTFNLLDDLHIGSGSWKSADQKEAGTVAKVQVDSDGHAWIPGSTLKGALRATCSDQEERLFGSPHGERAGLVKGCATIFGARSKAKPSTEILIQTKIHRGTGASEQNKLFQKEVVDKGAEFEFEILIESDKAKCDAAAMGRVLGKFRCNEGVPIGRGKNVGLGRIVLDQASASYEAFGGNGYSSPEPIQLTFPTPSEQSPLLDQKLYCRGPYLVARPTPKGSNVIEPLRFGDQPKISATGVKGVMKSLAEWLCRVDPSLGKGTQTKGNVETTLAERLFGAEGFAGKLRMVTSEQNKTGTFRFTSVAIDRFTHAPFTEALFEVVADHGVSFRLQVRLRPGAKPLDQKEEKLWSALKNHIREHGLALGKNTTKGFGRFFSEEGEYPKTFDARPKKVSREEKNLKIVRQVIASKPGCTSEEVIRYIRVGAPHLGKEEVERLVALAMGGAVAHERAASSEVPLPYRHVHVDRKKVGYPEQQVEDGFQARELHSEPLGNGLCGFLDVTWCFERPMQIKGEDGLPAKIGNCYILPGTTLRGAIRSILESVTSARLNRTNLVYHTSKREADRSYLGELHAPTEHQETYRPDFCEALFGFIPLVRGKDGKVVDLPVAMHDQLHLRSRLSFDMAWHSGGKVEPLETKTAVLAGPDPTGLSKIYDKLGRKRYPIDDGSNPHLIEEWIGKSGSRNDNMPSEVTFLTSPAGVPLQFRGRIWFHNVTPAELGALLWAVTWEWDEKRRHKIGIAKPFGAGICFAADLDLKVRPNDGSDPKSAADGEGFGLMGHSAKPYLAAFRHYLERNLLWDTQTREELIASATPGAVPNLSEYQTWKQLKEIADRVNADQGGRLTAMLAPK